MGAWGYQALESDEGLDVVDYLQDHIPANGSFALRELIAAMREQGFFGGDFTEIDFYYDHSAMALTELYLQFDRTGSLDYDHEESQKSLRDSVRAFSGDEASLRFLLRYLCDIRDEVPDADGEREIVELWRDSACWEEWQAHLNALIASLQDKLACGV